MGAVAPLSGSARDKAYKSFIHQRRRLQHMPRTFRQHATARQAVQFGVYNRRQAFKRRGIAGIPSPEHACELNSRQRAAFHVRVE